MTPDYDATKRYAEIKRQIKTLEAEAEFLHEEVLKQVLELSEDGEKPVDTEHGTFIIARRKVWQFSPAVEDLKKRAKNLESQEKADGTATCEEEPQLRFNPIKE